MNVKQRQIAIITVAGILILILWGAITAISHHGKAKVNIIVAPSDSSLTIDGQSAKPGNRWLTKTTHTFKATRQDFADDSKKIDLSKIDTSIPIYLTPKPNSEAADKYLNEHPEEQAKREAAGGVEEQRTQQQLTDYPIINQLPYLAPGAEFQVDYDSKNDANGKTSVTIYISAGTETAKQHALDWIKSQGTDPAKLNIVYQASSTPPAATNPDGFN